MAKSFSTTRPEKVAQYDHSHVILSYNIVAVEATEDREAGFEFDTVIVPNISKGAIVEALIRTGFSFEKDGNVVDHPGLSIGEEFALNRQRNSKKAEFNDYNDFAEAAKATADAILAE